MIINHFTIRFGCPLTAYLPTGNLTFDAAVLLILHYEHAVLLIFMGKFYPAMATEIDHVRQHPILARELSLHQ